MFHDKQKIPAGWVGIFGKRRTHCQQTCDKHNDKEWQTMIAAPREMCATGGRPDCERLSFS
jgi:uncharacterized protein YbdZ (MbtH family)